MEKQFTLVWLTSALSWLLIEIQQQYILASVGKTMTRPIRTHCGWLITQTSNRLNSSGTRQLFGWIITTVAAFYWTKHTMKVIISNENFNLSFNGYNKNWKEIIYGEINWNENEIYCLHGIILSDPDIGYLARNWIKLRKACYSWPTCYICISPVRCLRLPLPIISFSNSACDVNVNYQNEGIRNSIR